MGVMNLKDMSAAFAAAANSGDLDALSGLYAEDAVFVTPGGTVQGRAAIREVLAGLTAGSPKMEFSHTYIFENGDTAVARGAWKLTSAAADGTATVTTGNSIEILKKQADGSWAYFIDHPWGADGL
ncbi:MAG: nuclear transport factor 2 family protein [Bryobacteraceae bacterium]|nr:nuclear transport factor 2 family protein [Bryobacteraceae bacterium]